MLHSIINRVSSSGDQGGGSVPSPWSRPHFRRPSGHSIPRPETCEHVTFIPEVTSACYDVIGGDERRESPSPPTASSPMVGHFEGPGACRMYGRRCSTGSVGSTGQVHLRCSDPSLGWTLMYDVTQRKRHAQVRVEISVVYLKIGEIDTLKEHYEADVLIKAKWREPLLDRNKMAEMPVGSTIEWGKYWNPKLFIENTIGEPRETAFHMYTHTELGEAYVIEKRRVKGVFLENLELKDFPFDVQDLTVTVMSERSCLEIEMAEDPDDMHKVNKQSFIDEQEWHLYKSVETEIKEVTNEYADPSIKRSALSVKCRAARRPAYFFWNIFLITFLICTLAFATFAVERDLPQNRLQLSFTLVLTSVAFKFVVNQSLPKISYLTYLDKYVLATMILLTGVCAWHGLTSSIPLSPEKGKLLEMGALIFFMGGYFLFNLIFVIRIYMLPGRKRREMKNKERDYIDKMNMQILQRKARRRPMVGSDSPDISVI